MVKVRNFWEANFLEMEFALATVLSLLFTLWSQFVNNGQAINHVLDGNRSVVYGALVALFGSLLGFLITAVSIVLGYANSDKLAIVRESAHYQDLWDTFQSGIKVLAFATITALIGLVFDRDALPSNVFLYVNFFAVVLSTFRVARCIWILEYIILIVTKKRK